MVIFFTQLRGEQTFESVRVVVCCRVLQGVAICRGILRVCTLNRCRVLQCVAVCCTSRCSGCGCGAGARLCAGGSSSLLKSRGPVCVAVFCSVSQRVTVMRWREQLTSEILRAVVCCSVLQCVAVCCSVLQGVAGCCSVLQLASEILRAVVCCSVLQYVAVCCSVLSCVAVCCSSRLKSRGHVCCRVLQYVAVYCSVLSCVAVCCSSRLKSCGPLYVAVYCTMLQCIAVCCHVLQCVAAHV